MGAASLACPRGVVTAPSSSPTLAASNKLLRDTAIRASFMNTDTLGAVREENRMHPGMRNLQGLQPFLPR